MYTTSQIKDKLYSLTGRECAVESIEAVAGYSRLTIRQKAIRADQIGEICLRNLEDEELSETERRNFPKLIDRVRAKQKTPVGRRLSQMDIKGTKMPPSEIKRMLRSGTKMILDTSGDSSRTYHLAAVEAGLNKDCRDINEREWQRQMEFDLDKNHEYTVYIFKPRVEK